MCGRFTLRTIARDIAESRVFGRPFRRSRCLIVTDGFYEWEQVSAKKKTPILFTQRDESLFAFAGLMDRWTSPRGEVVESCSILTTSANALLAPIHDRMPVILPVAEYDRWLNPLSEDVAELQSLLIPYAAEQMQAERVSDVINNVRNEVDPRATLPSPANRNRTGRLFADDDY